MNETSRLTLKNWGLELTPEQEDRLGLFETELLEKNSRFNLVSENDADHIWPRHILDALAAAPLIRKYSRAGALAADAGSGAGFPGVPLAAVFEDLKFVLWDSNLKRHMFLTWVISRVKLKNAEAVHRRLGQSGPLETAGYDLVMERAMGKLENILPQCLNMLKEGGVFLAWQSSAPDLEAPGIKRPLMANSSEALEVFAYRLPTESKDRYIIVFGKNAPGSR